MFRNEQKISFSKAALSLAIAASLLVGACFLNAKAESTQDVNWYSWVAGKSVSVEFHFLDLLELLSR